MKKLVISYLSPNLNYVILKNIHAAAYHTVSVFYQSSIQNMNKWSNALYFESHVIALCEKQRGY